MELLGFIFGGLFRLLPKGLELWDKKNERQHEREMLQLQMQADEKRAQLQMQSMEKQGEIQQQLAEIQALIEATRAQAQTFQKTGNRWIDAALALAEVISATVRPVLTYWYCVAAYGAYKVAGYYLILSAGSDWKNAITTLWTPQDHAVMLSIVGFWFVDRAIRKREGS
jgi:hypothetical protein